MRPILVAGGAGDPNLGTVLDHARALDIPAIDLRIAPGRSPAFDWALPENRAFLDDVPLDARGAFLRYDVFASMADSRAAVSARANGWFTAINAWACSSGVRLLNRDASPASSLKPAVLALADQVGLRVPVTRVTNALSSLAALDDVSAWVAKPVAGGDYCRALADGSAAISADSPNAAIPAIVQRRLDSPELRLYVVGSVSVAFELRSESLDYREHQDARISEIEVPGEEDAALRRLMAALRMDFGAADFKRDPASGEWTFLELNSSPMFALFDEICGGTIGRAIVRLLAED